MPSWKVDDRQNGKRLDNVVAEHLDISVRVAKRLIADGMVLLDTKRASKGDRVVIEQTIAVEAVIQSASKSYDHVPTPNDAIVLQVVYEDEVIVAINKPPGIASHPLRASERDTVGNAIMARWPACATASEDAREAGLVHRLDRGTSGVLVAAKTRTVWTALREAFWRHDVDKTYWALVEGVLDEPLDIKTSLVTVGDHGRIAKPGEDGALDARTKARTIVQSERYSLLEATTITGRLHQVRVHLASTGHPLVGDIRYGARSIQNVPDEPLLHARAISLPHPLDGWRVTIVAPVPIPRARLIEQLLGKSLPANSV